MTVLLRGVLLLGLAAMVASKHIAEDVYMGTFLGRQSYKAPHEIRSWTPLHPVTDMRHLSTVELSVEPAVLHDGQDAFVSYTTVANASSQDYIAVSCGPTQGPADFLDAVIVGPPNTASITHITFAVGTTPNVTCPPNYIQIDVNLNDGTGGKFIYLCYTFDPAMGLPIASILTVAVYDPKDPCPEGYLQLKQDLNEGSFIHLEYVFMCISYKDYKHGVQDVEDIQIYSNEALFTCPPGFYDSGVDLNEGAAGALIFMCCKQGNSTLPVQNPVHFPQLVFMRCNYTFTYVSVQNGEHIALASVTVPSADSVGAPKQGHIALTGDPTQMAVMYVSGTSMVPSVRYGEDPNYLSSIAFGESSTYTTADMCQFPANITAQDWFRDPGYIHTVVLTGLRAGTQYFYQFGNHEDGWSQVYSFKSQVAASTRNVNFLAYADMGTWAPPSSQTTGELVNEDVDSGEYDFLLHVGDISYARGQAWIWDAFFSILEPYATRIPYMVSIGNHEYDYLTGGANDPSNAGGNGFHPSWGNMGLDSEGECAVPTYHRFTAPSNGNDIFWYSFDYGSVHVVQMSTEHDWLPGSTQYNWLAADLHSVNRTQTPWVILTGHRMLYTTQLQEEGDYEVSVHMRAALDSLLYENQVNLMLVGHQHSYERSCQVYRNECLSDGTGTVHMIIGTAGASLETGGFSNTLGNWSVAHIEQWGYLRIFATEDTLSTEFVLNDEDSVYDTVTLYPWPSSSASRHDKHSAGTHSETDTIGGTGAGEE